MRDGRSWKVDWEIGVVYGWFVSLCCSCSCRQVDFVRTYETKNSQ